jgi:hypothetical protein
MASFAPSVDSLMGVIGRAGGREGVESDMAAGLSHVAASPSPAVAAEVSSEPQVEKNGQFPVFLCSQGRIRKFEDRHYRHIFVAIKDTHDTCVLTCDVQSWTLNA